MEEPKRTNIYLDVDDDITAVIGKLHKAAGDEVALIVPKRSSVLQSAVNMKLLKKAGQLDKKRPVLITEDAVINKIAARLDVYTAATLQAEAAIPKMDQATKPDLPSEVIEGEMVGEASTESTKGKKGLDEKAAKATGAAVIAAAGAEPSEVSAGAGDIKRAKKSAIPNFERFKKHFFFGAIGLAGFIFLVWAMFVWLPKATIVITGTTAPLTASFDFTADTGATNADNNNLVLPATSQQLSKTFTANFSATGQKDEGTPATGTISIHNCDDTSSATYKSATNFTSNSASKVFTANSSFTVPAYVSNGPKHTCGDVTVNVTASANGTSYNIDADSYTSDSFTGGIYTTNGSSVSGSAMTGGTTNIQTVVQQSDVDTAQKNLLDSNRDAVKKELTAQFDATEYAIDASYTETVTQATSAPAVGQDGTTATLTLQVNYTEMGVKKADLDALFKQAEQDQADSTNQTGLGVVDDGLSKAKIGLKTVSSPTASLFHVDTNATLGPKIDTDQLKTQVAGKKAGDVVQLIKALPNVSNVQVKLSPFWVTSVPGNSAKITISISTAQ